MSDNKNALELTESPEAEDEFAEDKEFAEGLYKEGINDPAPDAGNPDRGGQMVAHGAKSPVIATSGALTRVLDDPGLLERIDHEKLTALFDLQERADALAARKEFYIALHEAKRRFRPIPELAWNKQTTSSYARMDTIKSEIEPILDDLGFVTSFSAEGKDAAGDTVFVLTVRHIAGHEVTSKLPLPLDYQGIKGTANKTKVHGQVSSFSYAERTLLEKFFSLKKIKRSHEHEKIDLDDDGNAAGGYGLEAPKLLSVEQQAAISAHLERSGRDESKFLAVYGAATVAEIPASCFQAALSMLQKAIAIQEGQK